DVLLEVDVPDTKGRLGLAHRGLDELRQLFSLTHDAHAAPAAARDGLDDDRIANLLRRVERLVLALHRTVAAGQHGHSGLLHRPARAGLVAHQPDDVRIRSDELDVAGFAH